MQESLQVVTDNFYELARQNFEMGDFFGFVENLSKAEVFAQEDPIELAQVYYLKVRGLVRFNHHQRVLQVAPKALEYNSGMNALRIVNWEGISSGNLGHIKLAEAAFLKVLAQIGGQTEEEKFLIFETCLNLVWLYLTAGKGVFSDKDLPKAKKYLDLASRYFDKVSDDMKRRYCNNYSVYCFRLGHYEAAIETLEEAIRYCTEKDLPSVYVNLAEVYLKTDLLASEEVLARFYRYCRDAEAIGLKYGNYLAIANAKAALAMIDLREEKYLSCLESLYLAVDGYKNAQAFSLAFDCWKLISEISAKYKVEMAKMDGKFAGTVFEEFEEGGECE